MPILHQHDSDSDAVKIAHDKEKTKRYFLYLASLVLLALVGIYFAAKNGGTVAMNPKDGSVSVKLKSPIVAQAGVPTKGVETPQGKVQFTTGKVNEGVIRQIESTEGSLPSTSFIGNNFINKDAGFLFSVDRPDKWNIISSSQSSGRATIVNNFVSTDGNLNNINVVIDNLPRPENITEYVAENIRQMMGYGMINRSPDVSYDMPSNTAYFSYDNLTTGGPTIQKIILSQNKAYIATANRSLVGGDNQTLSDMLKMVTSFTLIGN